MTRSLVYSALTLGCAACVALAMEAPPAPGGVSRVHLLPRGAASSLDLTDAQRKQLADLEAEAQTKLEHILTPAQVNQMKALRPSPPGDRDNRGQRPPRPESGREPERQLGAVAPAAMAQPLAAARPSLSAAPVRSLPAGVTRLPVVFSEGHDTVPVDHGRPVALIAAALGVHDEVFREAFSHVHPAGPGSGGPTETEARANKAALMNALGKFGVTNDRLNTVSNFYRYPPGSRSLWKNQPAMANALVKDGSVVGFEIVNGGFGYTTPPTVSIEGMAGVAAQVKLAYGKNMEANGTVAEITLSPSR